jgi:carboxylate-amine ligase
MADVRSVGVEEEMFLVDPATVRILPVSEQAIRADEARSQDDEDVAQELFLQQIEANTEATTDLSELREHIVAARCRAAEAAAAAGAAILAVPTPLLPFEEGDVTPERRYERMVDRYGAVGRRSVVCGMHVHAGIGDDDEGVHVIDRLGPWLPLVVALSASSPFDHGVDTGFASWRQQVWDGWPTAGPVEAFGSAANYHAAVTAMIATGAAIDEAMIYFDARLARSLPTVEIRVADVCTDIDDALVVAGLVRALVSTAAADSGPPSTWRVELLRASRWLARRDGLTDALLDPRTGRPVPARVALDVLLDHVAEALDAAGDTTFVRESVARLLDDRGPASRQRVVAGEPADVAGLARHLLDQTAASFGDVR